MKSEYGQEAEGDFDEAAWNDRRVALEEAILESVNELMLFMGCNYITLKDDLDNFTVKVRPNEELGCSTLPE